MKSKVAFTALIVTALELSALNVAQAASQTDVFNYLNQNLPKDGQYYSQDKSCSVVIDRSVADDIKVDVITSSDTGGIGVLNDGSQKVDTFKQQANSVQIKIETQASFLTSYGVLNVEQVGTNLVTFSAGSLENLLDKNPQLITCVIVVQ